MRARFLIAGVCWFLSAPIASRAASWQQQDPNANQQQTNSKDSSKQADSKKKSDAKDAPDAPAPQSDARQAPPADNQPPAAPAPSNGPKHSTLQDNPFPEDVSKKAADSGNADPAAADVPKADAPGGKAPEDTGSSSRQGMDAVFKDIDKDAPRDADATDPARAKEDDRIGKFYLNSGNYQGAYERFKDAASADPTDPNAVFGLAEAARKLNKRDEAIQNYQIYLLADPDSSNAKAAKKALSELHAPLQ
jgi:tetratricopeptide (TPR) repeat protein